MKRCITTALAIMILLGSFCQAAPLPKKKETVYINLDSYGKVEKVNVYSKWLTNGTITLKDNTSYITVSNLTNRNAPEISGDTYLWKTSGEEYFSYTGEVGDEYYSFIPWNFTVSYQVNGVEVSAEELLGANGLIKITMEIEANEKANAYYRNNYMLEITGTYDMSKYLSVNSEDAMITDTGNSKTLMFIVLPGQSTTIHLEIGSENFDMDGITMAMVPITGDVKEKIVELIEEKEDIEKALDAINESSDIVLNAMAGMTSGLSGMTSGVQEMKRGTERMHGLQGLRDEDIANLKTILNEMLPLLHNLKNDITNLSDTYDIVIELDETLQKQLKKLSSDVETLNQNMENVQQLMKNLPSDTEDIKELLKATETVANNAGSMVKKLSGASSDSEDALSKELKAIATETATIGATVQQTMSNVTDPEMAGALLAIGGSANQIGESLKEVQGTLSEMSSGTLTGTKNLTNSLNQLGNELNEVAGILNKKDAQKVVEFSQSILDTSTTLEKMLHTVMDYNDELLAKKDDFRATTRNMKQLVDELSKMDTLSVNMVQNVQSMLQILSSDFYRGTNDTLDSLTSLNGQLSQITRQSGTMKQSKDDIKKIVEDKKEDIRAKTTIFHLGEEDEVVSFGSPDNEYVESVQFVLKTPDIKNVQLNHEDLETEKETQTFWEKVVAIFQKIWAWITGIFQ